MKKVLLLFGGTSSENLISCKSANSILPYLSKDKYDVTSVYISLENKWYLNKEDDLTKTINWEKQKEITDIIPFLKKFDVVFPILHGKDGEDGKLQGMLSIFKIPYVGSSTSSSAIGMDKEFSKIIFDGFHIKQIPYICVTKDHPNYFMILKTLQFPLIVKPANGGSSIGINKANNIFELKKAIQNAEKYDEKIIVEEFIQGKELECAVLENNKIITSTVGEIICENEFYDYEAKYEKETITQIPADISNSLQRQIQKIAKKVFKRLGCKNLARIDFLYDEKNSTLYLNEINTLPGFTTISMYPKLLMYDGFSYEEILDTLIENAHF